MQKYLLLIMVVIMAASCDKVLIDKQPEISLWGYNKGAVKQLSQDSIQFHLSFTDQDGDLGSITNGATNTSNINFQDLRADGGGTVTFPFPDINTDVDTKSGYTGELFVNYQTDKLAIKNTFGIYDTVYFRVWVTDNKGNKSNEVDAGPILLIP